MEVALVLPCGLRGLLTAPKPTIVDPPPSVFETGERRAGAAWNALPRKRGQIFTALAPN